MRDHVRLAADGRSTSSKATPEVILDQELLVMYKPPFWKCELPEGGVKEPGQNVGARKQDEQSLLQWLRDKVPDIHADLFAEDFNPALSGTGFGPLSHRIDAETSGPLLVAKSKTAQKHIKSQFHELKVSKRYVCLVHGRVAESSGEIKDKIRTIRTATATRSEISSGGEWAQTNYQVIATYPQAACTLLACDIKSGRTHQIRVHMQNKGHPLVSDDKYQGPEQARRDRAWCPRLFLHCYRLSFSNMRNEQELVTCPLPPDLKSALRSLGAADETGHAKDWLFGETSWQREVLRPPLTSWQPGTAVLRKVVAILAAAAEPMSLAALSEHEELLPLLAEDGCSHLSGEWILRYWRLFQVETSERSGDFLVALHAEHADGSTEEVALDQQQETVQTELEELQRQKQRAVAREDYKLAEQLKRKMEALAGELKKINTFQQSLEDGGALTGATPKVGLEARSPQVFAEDVKDEALFPSLGPSKGAQRSLSVQRSQASSVSIRGSVGRAVSESATTRRQEPKAEEEFRVPDLKQAIFEFLEGKEQCVAMLNDINNNKRLRMVMAAQQPKLQAVNQKWLKNNEDTFVLLKAKDGETYVGLQKQLEAQAKARAGKAGGRSMRLPGDEAKTEAQPAYNKVIQKIPGSGDAAPLIYNYAEKEKESLKPKEWEERFLAVLRNTPQRYCKAEELLAAVPAFSAVMGGPRPREKLEMLVLFLESFKETIAVEKRGAGAAREILVWAK